MVPLTDAVAATLAAQIATLRDKLSEAITASSPEGEFARFVFDSVGTPVPFNPPSIPLDPEPLRLGRAPSLAAAGYRLNTHLNQHALLEAWREGFQRLMGTNAFPQDRMSFAYRPVDLLGLAIGAITLSWEDGAQWLRDVVRRRKEEERISECPGLIYLIAARVVGLPVAPPAVAALTSEVEVSLLAFLRWWSSWSGVSETTEGERLLDQALLTRLTVAEVNDLDVPCTSMVLQATEAAVRRRVAWYVSSSEVFLAESDGNLGILLSILRRFNLAAQQLQRRSRQREAYVVKDEYDVQDLIYAILKLHFDDVRPEEWTPSYAGHSSRMDFLLKPERIVVEVKMTRSSLRQKQVSEELAIDKDRYRAHPDCQTLVCFVYDPGMLCTNPTALETDLSRTEGEFRVIVVVAPAGR